MVRCEGRYRFGPNFGRYWFAIQADLSRQHKPLSLTGPNRIDMEAVQILMRLLMKCLLAVEDFLQVNQML